MSIQDMIMPAGSIMTTSYDYHLVALSVVVAIVGAYVGLTLSERVTMHEGKARYLWLVGGAIAFGSAVWAMHFTGMLAFRLPVDVDYDMPIVGLSLVVAVLAAGVALFTVSRPRATWRASIAGAVVMGGGIGSMHYLGMFAMRMQASMRWDLRIVALSAVVAIVLSLVALRLSIRLQAISSKRFGWHRIGAAVVMGTAIASMHYTGMAAATFVPASSAPSDGLLLDGDAMGGAAIALITLLVSGFAILLAFLDRRFAAQDSALAQSQRRLSMVVANAPVVLFALDSSGIITFAEGRDLAAIRKSAEPMIGRSFLEICNVPALIAQARRALAGEEHTALSTLHGVVLETHWTPVWVGGRVDSVVAVSTDITERRRDEIALRHLALHDSLTGLPNRAFFNERLAKAMEAAAPTGEPVALCLIDLDRFKDVNDTLGHDAGDLLLQYVASQLGGVLREPDLVARFGGDEFAVLLPATAAGEAAKIVRRLLASLSTPCVIKGRSIDVAASIGLALSPLHGSTPATLLRSADVAMYAAKRCSGGFVTYDPALDHMEERLRKALREEAFTIAYEPIYELHGRRLMGSEALIRWTQAEGADVPPNAFIPCAEESGLIVPIGTWILRTACAQIAAWNSDGHRLEVTVNVSTKQIADPNFVRTVKAALNDSGLAPELLELELAETAITANIERSAAVVSELHALGVRIAVDELGTGYNSLSALRSCEVDTLKLDRCFVTDIVENTADRAIASAVISAARALGARVIAKGIETAEQLATLVELQSEYGQGPLFSRPLPAYGFEQLVLGELPRAAA